MMNYEPQSLRHIDVQDASDTGDVSSTDLFVDLASQVQEFLLSLHGEGRMPIVSWIEKGGRVRVDYDFPINSASFRYATAMGATSCAATSRIDTVTRRLIAELEN